MDTRRQSGFTLWELLITLLVAGILVGIGLPSLRDVQRNNAITSAANDIITDVLASRAEAVKRRVPVTFCASPDPTVGNPVCSQNGAGTGGGFIVWVDFDPAHVDANQTPVFTATDGNAVVDANETILIRQLVPPSMVPNGPLQIFMNSGYFTFGPNGLPANVGGAPPRLSRILYCDDRGNKPGPGGANFSTARTIFIDQLGRANVETAQADIVTAVAQIGGAAACP
jgi:type IV fimbrial biogenesis protein FimT